jgi:hypothetical protein
MHTWALRRVSELRSYAQCPVNEEAQIRPDPKSAGISFGWN